MSQHLPLLYVAGLIAWIAALTAWAIGIKNLKRVPQGMRETRLKHLSNRLMTALAVSIVGALGGTIISLVLDGSEPGPGVLRDVVLASIVAVTVACVVMRALLLRVATRLMETWTEDAHD